MQYRESSHQLNHQPQQADVIHELMPINRLFSSIIRLRMANINRMLQSPVESQRDVFRELSNGLLKTKFGKKHGFSKFSNSITIKEFKAQVPIRTYDDIKPWISRARDGERDVLWTGDVTWFAKTSGTTSDRSKLLPVTKDSLKTCHYKGGRDLLAMFCDQRPQAPLYSGKHLIIGGSSSLHPDGSGSYTGDLSAIIVRNLPPWVEMRRTPGRDITLLEDWEEKVDLMADQIIHQDVRILAGIPSWMLVVADRVLDKTGANSLDEVWPNLWLYMHGGVGFAPYKSEFKRLIRSPNINYMETYNASEGFFGIQESLERDDMALLLDHGIFYEFMPLNEVGNPHPITLDLRELEIGEEYALVISTNAGLWRYMLGDVIRLTSRNPYRIKVAGRVSSFLNVVGEELMVDQVERAISTTMSKFSISAKEFTVAPRFAVDGHPIGHTWVIELMTNGVSTLSEFDIGETLDKELKSLNSDYDAKRTGDLVLQMPEVHIVESGTFEVWLKENNKLGGQHKIPRLSNSRLFLDEILRVIPNQ